jgi:hypothetical protein
MPRPTVPALTPSNGHTTAVDHIATPPQPYGGHVYVEEGNGKGRWVELDPETLEGHIVSEHVTFTPDAVPTLQVTHNNGDDAVTTLHPSHAPPLGWVPVDPNIGTPIYDQLNADCQPGRTPTGRISRKPPRLPYTGGVSYPVFIQGSRDDHGTYFGGRR